MATSLSRLRSAVSLTKVERSIRVLRGHRVLLDVDLAALYGVDPRALNQSVRRNAERFPDDFMFRLTADEARSSRSQIVILNAEPAVTAGVSASRRRRGGNIKHLPYAFTEQGVAMLSSVLRSPRAVEVNIEIMRAFVRLRQILQSNVELSKRLDDLEKKYDGQFRVVFDAIRELMTPPEEAKPPIGFAPQS
jgi:hypothetical protein